VGLLGGQAHIGHAIFAVIRTHDMGISGLTRLMVPWSVSVPTAKRTWSPACHWARNVSVWLARTSGTSPGRGRGRRYGTCTSVPSSVTTWATLRPFLAT